MKSDYFNLIESKVNGKKSKLLKHKQKGGMLPMKAAQYAVKKFANNPKVQNMVKKGMSNAMTLGSKGMSNSKKVSSKGMPNAMTVSDAMSGAKKFSSDAMSGAKKFGSDAMSGAKTVGSNAYSGMSNVAKSANEKIGKPISNSINKSYNKAKKSYEKSVKIQEAYNKITPNNSESPSYPEKLQVVPRHRHTEKKLSETFNTHLENIKTRIDDVSDKIDKQSNYVAEEQRILDAKKKFLDDMYATSSLESAERSWDMIKSIASAGQWFVDSFMSIIRWFLLLLVKLLMAMQPLMWAIAAIICVFVLIMLIAWLIRGGKFKVTDNNGNEVGPPTEDDVKDTVSKNYGSGGTYQPWNWNNFIKNPIKYTLERNLNEVNNSLNIPDVLNKIRIQNPIYTLRKNFKLLNNDNFKTARIQNETQREDNISFINYALIDEKISKYYRGEVPEEQNNNFSISLIRPKNIEWELPHLDYANTDMSKLPESIKNYKDNTDPDSLSLNEKSKIIFPWKLTPGDNGNDSWVLDCNTKFINGNSTDLYQDDDSNENCIAKVSHAVPHPP